MSAGPTPFPVFPRLTRRRLESPLVVALPAIAACVLTGVAIGASSASIRVVLAVTIAGLLILMGIRAPAVAIAATIVWLFLLGLVRRLLIDTTGWPEHDPLLLIGPAVAVALFIHLYLVEQRRLGDRAINLAGALLLLATLNVLNPSGGGIVVGLGGLLFMGVPLLWFLAGRAALDRRSAQAIATVVLAGGTLVALYGTLQLVAGFPEWDKAWLEVANYSALNVGTATRPFGTFTAASEYLIAIGSAAAVATAYALSRKPQLLVLLPFLMGALFFGSGRSTFLYAMLAIAAITLLYVTRGRGALVLLPSAALLTVIVILLLSPVFSAMSATTSSPLVGHLVSGLANPLDERHSTLRTHVRAFAHGVETGLRHPVGLGTGASNISADKLGGADAPELTVVVRNGRMEVLRGTDIDVSNVFLGLGILGGVMYLALIATVLQELLRRYRATRDTLYLAILGLAIVGAGQWLTGGHYAMTAALWALLGWATRPETAAAARPRTWRTG